MPFRANTSDLTRLKAQMKGASREVRSTYRKGLKDVGNRIADSAKDKIEDKSPETAALIKVRTRLPASVIVQGGDKDHPIGKLLEGHDGIKGFWTHPLFGSRKRLYSEARHPHLYPAFAEHKDDSYRELKEHVNEAMHSVGLKGDHDG